MILLVRRVEENAFLYEAKSKRGRASERNIKDPWCMLRRSYFYGPENVSLHSCARCLRIYRYTVHLTKQRARERMMIFLCCRR